MSIMPSSCEFFQNQVFLCIKIGFVLFFAVDIDVYLFVFEITTSCFVFIFLPENVHAIRRERVYREIFA